jgi:hypothetical protein
LIKNKLIKTDIMNGSYLVGDTNGTFLSKHGNETTSVIDNAKVFDNIGDAIRACVDYNKNAHTFRVIPM